MNRLTPTLKMLEKIKEDKIFKAYVRQYKENSTINIELLKELITHYRDLLEIYYKVNIVYVGKNNLKSFSNLSDNIKDTNHHFNRHLYLDDIHYFNEFIFSDYELYSKTRKTIIDELLVSKEEIELLKEFEEF
ncbi:MAG: hypothetical protein E7164_01125 [Firmicutes bacterium]|nr:hypothetical protein [Bacillota bacterium]